MIGSLVDTFSSEQHDILIRHYERVAPMIERSFGGTPLVTGFVPDWNAKTMVFESRIATVPASIATIDVELKAGRATYAQIAENALLWQAHRGALSFLSWTPLASDPTRARFGRILLEPSGAATVAMVREAAIVVRALLQSYGLQSLVLLGGFDGLALWIPFSDGPDIAALRLRLDQLTEQAAAAHPMLVTTQRPIAERGDRVHLAASSNAVGRYSALPYTLRALDALPVVTPIAWNELATTDPGAFPADVFGRRLDERGDVFAELVEAIGSQSSSGFLASTVPARRRAMFVEEPTLSHGGTKGRVILAAIAILEDGRPRDAEHLLAESIARGLLPATTSKKDVYTELIEYISRAKGTDRTPKIVQDPDRRFRRNLPADDWPQPATALPSVAPAKDAEAIVVRLNETAKGDDPAAYEQAVCDAFAALGFVARHLGGEAAPDGYVDAPLGSLGYRVMLECKRGLTIVQQPDAAEAAKYVTAYRAASGALVGPAYGDDAQLASELQTHGVTAFANDDLAQLLRAGANPEECRAIFAPGFASERIEAMLWERAHGLRKRIAVVAGIVWQAGWREQVAAAGADTPSDAPLLDEDAAMMLVDQQLLGSAGSVRPCTRDEVRAAFAHLCDPLTAAAQWLGTDRTAIAIVRGLSDG